MFGRCRVIHRGVVTAVAGLCLFARGTLAEAAKPIGRFLAVTGDVRVLDLSMKSRAAEVFGSFYAEDSLEFSAKSSVVVSFRNGSCVQIADVATATLKESGVEPVTAAKPLKLPAKTKKLVGDFLTALPANGVGGVTVQRSEDPKPPTVDVSPIVGSTVLSPLPTFVWPPRADAKSYELILKKPAADINKEVWKTETTAHRVEYAGKKKLPDNKEYRWEVYVTLKAGKVESLCQGTFHTSTDEMREDAADLIELAGSMEPALVAFAAIRLEELGLYAEAIGPYERLVKIAPRRGEFPAALSELYDKAGRTAEAAESRARAKQLGYSFTKKDASNGAASPQ